MTGLNGKVFKDQFYWAAGYSHGGGITHTQTENNINASHFYAALDGGEGFQRQHRL